MRARLQRHHDRLRDIFQHALIVALATPLAACTQAAEGGGSDASAGDASLLTDASEGGSSDDVLSFDDGSLLDDAAYEWCEAGVPEVDDAATSGNCDYFMHVPCGLPDGAVPLECGYLTFRLCKAICPRGAPYGCRVASVPCDAGTAAGDGGGTAEDAGDVLTVECIICHGGRRPRGLRARRPVRSGSVVGDFFARTSHLEAASVIAFRHLERDLAALDAPRELRRAARSAARDEVKHARTTREIARRYGGRVAAARAGERYVRSAEDIAIENAVEGCVRETYAALVAHWQAAHASDERIRAAMTRIAADETRHAALAWSVAEWLRTRLHSSGRARVARRRRRAVRKLAREVDRNVPHALVEVAGVPNRDQALSFLRSLDQSLW